jgi:hypothetical protein
MKTTQHHKFRHFNWEIFTIWCVVVVSFAALFAAGYILWAKCHG